MDPWVWERIKTQDYPLETYGGCTCNNFWAWFGPLISLVVFSSVMVLYYAYKSLSLDISEELGDRKVRVISIVLSYEYMCSIRSFDDLSVSFGLYVSLFDIVVFASCIH